MKATIRAVHKYASLVLAAVWLLQALTGVMLSFRGEIDGLNFPQPPQPFDAQALGRSIVEIDARHPDKTVPYVFASMGSLDRFDLYLVDAEGNSDILRLDGDGTVLRARPSNHDLLEAGWFKIALTWHESFFLSGWLVGLSGLLLLTNLILGVKLAWPRARQWKRTLLPRGARGAAAKLYGWHRAVGLWFVVPALFIVTTGILQIWGGPVEDVLGPVAPPPAVERTGNPDAAQVSPAGALEIALGRYPGAHLSILEMPQAEAFWYKVRLLQDDEIRRIFGTTTLYIDAANGEILADYDALKAPAGVSFFNSLYAVHTGEILGTAGRVINLSVGLWLITMIGLGLSLWWKKRRPR